ncbi:4a-hydroxytetrahydrobiopterin dehydratase [Sedimentimonas flavescens]|uniref:Putative pterin-4-alpha-carbinolamine dehydratase n=1 Tax=Sedimentimonas flavescens TaxID=2851012 RepID=A0ABT3A2R8_9RHOB|nr:4a-hydroxytetrahydrobiopterin dehydratase [Sedimentimonas flavescens]MCV2880257.1 4a-hydroxytetrahydrobiopterin dehydratase [Sedimentimonas flavescens]
MAKVELLSLDERQALLPPLEETGWRADPEADAIRKVWKFRNFSQAWGFMSRAALISEKMTHHPDWRNVFNVVDVTLSTHSCGGMSILDVELARALDALPSEAVIEQDHSQPIACLCGQA